MNLFNLARLLPQLSILTLVFVAVFNIGYFSEIGIHFIGLLDVGNLVYTFALFFPVIVLLIYAIFSDFLFELFSFAAKPEASNKFRWFILRVFFPIALLLGLAYGVARYYFGIDVPRELLIALLLIFLIVILLSGKVRYHRDNRLYWDDVGTALLLVFLLTHSVGRYVGHNQIFGQVRTYSITTKDLTLQEARMVRIFREGLLIFAGERILFVPKEEVRLVRANQDLKQ